MMTLKHLYLVLEDWLMMHPEINSVTRLDVKDFIGNRTKIYTNANIYFANSVLSNKFITHSFLVTISDRLTPDSSNETEIFSNVLAIAEDFFTWLGNSYDFTFTKNANVQTFSESDGDRTSGIYFTLNIQALRSQSPCTQPDTLLTSFPSAFPEDFEE